MISKSGDFEMRLNIWCTLLCTCICLFSPCHVLLFFSACFFFFFFPNEVGRKGNRSEMCRQKYLSVLPYIWKANISKLLHLNV